MISESTVVVACASGFGKSAIGVVQLAGSEAGGILQKFFSEKLSAEVGKIQLGDFIGESGEIIDQVLIVKLPVEEVVYEITAHGGVRILQRIISCLEGAGAELVDSYELIDRVYGLDNVVAKEAYRLLPKVKTPLAGKFLLYQAERGLSSLVGSRDKKTIKDAFEYWPAVRALIEGVKIVITGPPNAGKSTLVNALGRVEHSLVADFPGTTRDYVCADVQLGDIPAELVDTAGLGKSDDIFKGQSENHTRQQIRQADIIFIVLDATDIEGGRKFISEFLEIANRTDKILVLVNKTDKGDFDDTDFLPAGWRVLRISALKGINLGKIPEIVWSLAGLDGFDYRRATIFSENLGLYFSE